VASYPVGCELTCQVIATVGLAPPLERGWALRWTRGSAKPCILEAIKGKIKGAIESYKPSLEGVKTAAGSLLLDFLVEIPRELKEEKAGRSLREVGRR